MTMRIVKVRSAKLYIGGKEVDTLENVTLSYQDDGLPLRWIDAEGAPWTDADEAAFRSVEPPDDPTDRARPYCRIRYH